MDFLVDMSRVWNDCPICQGELAFDERDSARLKCKCGYLVDFIYPELDVILQQGLINNNYMIYIDYDGILIKILSPKYRRIFIPNMLSIKQIINIINNNKLEKILLLI